uniref:Myb/SANT-like domain-containing protein n=1 Tax=Setaria viridis TaxID=4556 RepID=A0A4U6T0N3_SETVI|nr:hypothetical protein SEVIR_9G334000v2 [Setaria viridis]
MDGHLEGLGGANGMAAWTSPMSTFMLKYLANVVASGAKTTKGFKKSCQKEKFTTLLTSEQMKNHLKTWQRKWSKITKLKSLSASRFDKDNYIVTLDDEYYNNHDHKADPEYLNKPLENYDEMETIFRNSMATDKFAKDSSVALGTEDGDTEEGARNDDGLIGAFNKAGDKLAIAITQVAKSQNELPEDLFDKISMYYAHLVANPLIAKAFYGLPFDRKLHWMAMFVSERFHGW